MPTLETMSNACLCSAQGAPVPLLGVAISGRVFGAHARVVLRQRYVNRETRPIEAVYTFPIPADAALVGFAMETAQRRLSAVVQEREQAFATYDAAIAAGHGAALLDQERRNVFTASVGNLLPGEETVIEVVYVQELAADEGALRLTIPTLVAPRYIGGGAAGDRTGHGVAEPTDRVPDADRITPAIGAVDYGFTLDLSFELGRDVTIESPSHAIAVTRDGGRRRVALAGPAAALDRDLVLVAAGAPGSAAGVVAARRIGEPGTFALTVVPDLFDGAAAGTARDVVFVVDVSGSMQGASLTQARAALRLCLRHLGEGDRFQIVAFSDRFIQFAPRPVAFTQATLTQADAWVDARVASGGTEMQGPLLAALEQFAEQPGRDRVVVLLTDGQIGDEARVVEAVVARAGRTRIYTFGIGTNISDLLIRDLARRTHGTAAFIHPGERIDDKVTAQFARALALRVEDLKLEFDGLDPQELAPADPPPLIDGEPWVLYGRYETPGWGTVRLRGTLRGRPFALDVAVELPSASDADGLTALWAAARIRELEQASLTGRRAEANVQRIVALSVAHGVASKYASFVVVEERRGERRAHGQPEARPVLVHAPAGWAVARPARVKTMLGGMPIVGAAPRDPQATARPGAVGLTRADAGNIDGFGALGEAVPAGGSGSYQSARAGEGRPGLPPPPAPVSSARPVPPPGPPRAPVPPGRSVPMPEPARAAVPAPTRPRVPASPSASVAASASAARSSGDAPVTGLAAEFARQLASGLWDGADGSDRARLAATTRVLEACAAEHVDSAHPIFGTPLRKAIAALCSLALALVGKVPAAELDRSLAAALAVASGRRLRAEVEQAREQIAAP